MTNCSIEMCDAVSYVKTYCSKHYARYYRYGDVNVVRKLHRQLGKCRVDGCTSKIYSGMMCDMHYKRTKNTPTRMSWIAMRQRCNYKRSAAYKYYGGRGVKVCERWDSFELFLADMGERPEGSTLDRIDPYGDYEPTNCRWADIDVQSRNKRLRTNNKSGFTGVYTRPETGMYRVSIAADKTQISIGSYKTLEEAISARLMAESIYWQ